MCAFSTYVLKDFDGGSCVRIFVFTYANIDYCRVRRRLRCVGWCGSKGIGVRRIEGRDTQR